MGSCEGKHTITKTFTKLLLQLRSYQRNCGVYQKSSWIGGTYGFSKFSTLSISWNTWMNFVSRYYKKIYGPFLWMGFNCLKVTEPLLEDCLVFTTKSPGISRTHFIELRRIKRWVNLGATQWCRTWHLRTGNPVASPLGHPSASEGQQAIDIHNLLLLYCVCLIEVKQYQTYRPTFSSYENRLNTDGFKNLSSIRGTFNQGKLTVWY